MPFDRWLRRQPLAHRALSMAQAVLSKLKGPSWNDTFDVLRRYNLTPKTIFDIGVARGTPRLYAAFPDAAYHLIDPTHESLPFMKDIAKRYNARVYNVALGAQEGTFPIIVREGIGASSFYTDVADPSYVKRYDVPVVPFDKLIAKFARPALAKIDVQGAEMLVLEGMASRLRDLDAIIIEISTITTLHEGPELREVVRFFACYNWSLADVMSTTRRPLDGALAQLDLLFVPDTSPLRSDNRWEVGPAQAA